VSSSQSGVELARRCLAAGRFGEALRAAQVDASLDSPEDCVVLAEARWRVGQLSAAEALLDRCGDPSLSDVLGKATELRAHLAREDGRFKDALGLFNRCIEIGEENQDLAQVCRAQLALFSVLLDQHGSQACESVAADVRRNVIRSGEPVLFAWLHRQFAEFEARAGNSSRAFRHLEAGFKSVALSPNPWLLGSLWIVQSSVEGLNGAVSAALRSARKARDFAKISGHERSKWSALSNIGYLSIWAGDFPQASAAFDELAGGPPKGGQMWLSVLDSRAQLELARGDLATCEHLLVAGETELRLRDHALTAWPHVEFRLARVRREAAAGRYDAAIAIVHETQPIVDKRGDSHLRAEWALERSVLSIRLGDLFGARQALDDFIGLTAATDVGRRGDVHWLRGELARASGDLARADMEFARASRIWEDLGGHSPHRSIPSDLSLTSDLVADCDPTNVATLLALGGHPRLLGREAAETIGIGSNALRLRVVAGPPGGRRTIFDWQRPGAEVPKVPLTTVSLGAQDENAYNLQVYTANDPGARAAVSAVVSIVEAAVGLARLRRDERYRTSLWPVEEGLMLEGNVFVAPRMREIHSMARRVAPSDLPVLITGETGSGKEIIAREVHDSSSRAAKSFGVLVCSAVPREMLDSHLFGHRKGAFTGAIDSFPGVIRANEGGTLFLDEIGEVSLDLQVKLLRFLETGEVHPLGETKPVKVNVRVIAATNQPLETLIKEGRFREDLFYRLNVVRITIPPLRERREEILPFFERFLMRECARIGRPVPNLSDETVEHLLLYTWPGNVRQLLNEVKRVLATLPPSVEITPAALSSGITEERQAAIAKAVAASPNQMLVRTDQPLAAAIEEVERAMLKGALASSPDLEAAAEKLDITRKGLFLKRQRLGLE
jgi:DNA-binding NtrC family response regulator/tetratricopeptide (TPR) repeat protein